jgi:micrococcal nuclease
VELRDGRLLRYIGVDTPEVRRRDGKQWVEDPEPFGRAATEANRKLVDGQRVRLEYDVQRYDRYGRTLAYVYVTRLDGDTVMVNEWLVRQGLAQPLTIPPNVKYADKFRAAANAARAANVGLWRREND